MKRTIFSIVILVFVSLAGSAQVKVDNSGFTTIGGGPVPPSLPSLWVRGGCGYNVPYPTQPTSPAKIAFGYGSNTWMIYLSETDPSYPQLDIYSNLGTTFSGGQGVYMRYVLSRMPPYEEDTLHVDAKNFRFKYGTCISLFQSSDEQYKKEVTKLSNSLAQLAKLRGVNYRWDFTGHPEYGERKVISIDSLGNKVESIVPALVDETKQIGFLAQELQQVFPELVRGEPGNLSINYTGLIPVIVEAMKEQQAIVDKQGDVVKAQSAKITELQAELNALRDGKATPQAKGIEALNAFLYQNAPNPFSHNTTIRYFLGEETANAAIYIFDMQGKLIESHPISDAGEGAVEISASGLQPGMYLYSLLVNNQEVDTKRMVITE